MKINNRKIKLILFILIISYAVNTHAEDACVQKRGDLPFTFHIVEGSREVVMVQNKPWEEQMMAYYKVLKVGRRKWQMWYSAWDNNRKSDYSNYLTYAHSKDGKNWIKSIPGKKNNILRGTGHPNIDGIVEQDVIIDESSPLKYKMIYTACDLNDNGKEKTFLEESADGINWTNKRILWNRKHDSQFSVIERDGLYYIYLRYWEIHNGIRYRTIGLAITDKNWNTISEPKTILKADFGSIFPHLYNPAASKISDDLDLLFPTYFNEKSDSIKVCLAYTYKGKSSLTDIDITEDLFKGVDANWVIAMPGLVKEGKDSYWLYYYGSNMLHSQYLNKSKDFIYYRIKLKINEK